MNDSTQFPKNYRVYLTLLTGYVANGQLRADATDNGDFEEISAFSAQDAALEYMDIYLQRRSLGYVLTSITNNASLTCRIIVHATETNRWSLFNLIIIPKLMIKGEGVVTLIERTKP